MFSVVCVIGSFTVCLTTVTLLLIIDRVLLVLMHQAMIIERRDYSVA